MRNKKLLSTVVVAALAASTMAMPVMAADGGQVDVDITTRKAIIRVEVPTSLEIAVNQFEKEDAGSQIYSGKFDVKNKSEIPVQLTVDSELKMDQAVKLLPTKAGAEASKVATGEAWLAVAAQIAPDSYVTGDTANAVADLTEANRNVTTFVQDETTKTKATAQQVFYLDKASTSNVAYKGFVPSADGKVDSVSYAQFYKIEDVTLAASSEQASLDAAIAAGDVYETANSVTDVNGVALTLTAKKGGSATVDASNKKYYKAAAEPTAAADLKSAEKYVYGEDGDGGSTVFRYVGKLSEGKETWTAADFEEIHIKYDIVGATTTKYAEKAADCVNGLYKEKTDVGPSIAQKTYTMTAGQAISVQVDLGSGDKAASKVSDIKFGGASMITTNMASYDSTTKTVTITKNAVDYFTGSSYKESSAKIAIEFDDDESSSIEITLNK